MRSFLAKQLLQGALSSAKSGSPSATAGSWRPIPFSVLVVQMLCCCIIISPRRSRNSNLPEGGSWSLVALNWAFAVRERLSELPVYFSGKTVSGASEISKAQFCKLLKQAGALELIQFYSIIESTFCKRNALLPSTGDILGLGSQASNVFLVADIDGSSLIVCGKAFADADSVRDALSALCAPVLSAKGVPVSARPLAFGDSLVLLFASEDTIKSCSDLHGNLISADAGVVLCSYGVTPFFQTGDAGTKLIQKACICGFCICRQMKDHEIPAFFINVNDGGKHIDGKDLVKSTLSKSILESTLGTSSDPKVGALKEKYKSFLSSKFPEIPEEFTFRMPK